MASPKMKKITGPKAAANYFRNLLQNQILIFKEMCDEWTKYKASYYNLFNNINNKKKDDNNNILLIKILF